MALKGTHIHSATPAGLSVRMSCCLGEVGRGAGKVVSSSLWLTGLLGAIFVMSIAGCSCGDDHVSSHCDLGGCAVLGGAALIPCGQQDAELCPASVALAVGAVTRASP